MVNRKHNRIPLAFAFALAFSALHGTPARAETPDLVSPRLITECYPRKIYPGQTTVCSFIVTAKVSAVEVEVAKFPEFRGFWTDNLSLRQGPLGLNQVYAKEIYFRATVGSYSLSPMVSRDKHTIEPMKLVVKMLGAVRGIEIASEPPQVEILPLPKPAAGKEFKGAVGRFQFLAESPSLPFQKDEPVTLRYLLVGDGNFQDILTPKLEFPDFVEVISSRAILEGANPAMRKTFEYSLVVHEEKSFSLPPGQMLALDPAMSQYYDVTIPGVEFRAMPKPPLEQAAARGDVLATIATGEPTFYSAVTDKVWFWIAQGIFGVLFLIASILQFMSYRREQEERSPLFVLRLRYEIALEAARNDRVEDFLRLSDEISVAMLRLIANTPPSLSRVATLERAKGKLDETTLREVSALFAARDNYLYSPERTLTVPVEKLQTTLDGLFRIKKAA